MRRPAAVCVWYLRVGFARIYFRQRGLDHSCLQIFCLLLLCNSGRFCRLVLPARADVAGVFSSACMCRSSIARRSFVQFNSGGPSNHFKILQSDRRSQSTPNLLSATASAERGSLGSPRTHDSGGTAISSAYPKYAFTSERAPPPSPEHGGAAHVCGSDETHYP